MVYDGDDLLEEGGEREEPESCSRYTRRDCQGKRLLFLTHTNTPSILFLLHSRMHSLPLSPNTTPILRSLPFTRLALLVNPNSLPRYIIRDTQGILRQARGERERLCDHLHTEKTGRKKMQPREKKQGEQPLNHHQNNLSLNHHLFFSLYLSS